jgi:branched-subunit amino acid transport protein
VRVVTPWLVIIAVGVGTYTFRAIMFVVLADRHLPAWTDRPLGFVAPGAIGALVGGMVLTSHGSFAPAGLAELCATTAAFVTVRRWGDVSRGLLVGFAILWTLSAFGL